MKHFLDIFRSWLTQLKTKISSLWQSNIPSFFKKSQLSWLRRWSRRWVYYGIIKDAEVLITMSVIYCHGLLGVVSSWEDCNQGNRRRIGHFGSGITHDMKICSEVFINIPVSRRFATFWGTIGFFVSIKNAISNDQIFKNWI